jgi:hypothetical protein
MKSPDQSFKIFDLRTKKHFNRYPSFVVEVGYSKTWAELKRDAADWLRGSHGQVLAVLIMKLTKPALDSEYGDVEKWKGFIELYTRR